MVAAVVEQGPVGVVEPPVPGHHVEPRLVGVGAPRRGGARHGWRLPGRHVRGGGGGGGGGCSGARHPAGSSPGGRGRHRPVARLPRAPKRYK